MNIKVACERATDPLLIALDSFYEEIAAVLGPGSRWTQLWTLAFGVAEVEVRPRSLRERVIAGLWLYVHIAELLSDVLQPEHAMLVQATVQRVKDRLEERKEGGEGIPHNSRNI